MQDTDTSTNEFHSKNGTTNARNFSWRNETALGLFGNSLRAPRYPDKMKKIGTAPHPRKCFKYIIPDDDTISAFTGE
jgi:hypothetical protein